MFCSKCGKQLPEGAKFCPKCGYKLDGTPNEYLKNKIKETSNKVTNEIIDSVDSITEEVNSTVNKVNETKEKVKTDIGNIGEDMKSFKFSDLLEKKYVDLGSLAAALGPFVMVVMVYIVLDILGMIFGLLVFVPVLGRILSILLSVIYYVPLVLFMVLAVYSFIMLIYRAASKKETDVINIIQIVSSAIAIFSLLGYFIRPIAWARWIGLVLIVFALDFFVKAIINGEEISGGLNFGEDFGYIKTKMDEIKAQRQAEKEAQAAAEAEMLKDMIQADVDDGESTFDGSGFELFGYELLGVLLSLITCGLALPYVLVKITNWRVSHTIINGKRLSFNGKALQLWGLYIKWYFLTLITCGIYGFFAYVDYKKWEARHTTYDGSPAIRGIYPGSQFTGNSFEYIGYSLLTELISLVTCGIAYPWMECILHKWETTHTHINKQKLSLDLTGGKMIGTYFLVLILTIITCGIYGPWGTCRINRKVLEHTHIDKTYVER